jgi:hypothetical protein
MVLVFAPETPIARKLESSRLFNFRAVILPLHSLTKRPWIVSAAFVASCCEITELTNDSKFVSERANLPMVQSGLRAYL